MSNDVPFPASDAKCKHGIPLYACLPCSRKLGPKKLVDQYRKLRFERDHPDFSEAPMGTGLLPGGKFGKGSLK